MLVCYGCCNSLLVTSVAVITISITFASLSVGNTLFASDYPCSACYTASCMCACALKSQHLFSYWLAGAVSVLALSADCGMLATAGQDSTIFLFKVATATMYEPVGFFRLQQPACCLAWSPDSAKILIGCRYGSSAKKLGTGPLLGTCLDLTLMSAL